MNCPKCQSPMQARKKTGSVFISAGAAGNVSMEDYRTQPNCVAGAGKNTQT